MLGYRIESTITGTVLGITCEAYEVIGAMHVFKNAIVSKDYSVTSNRDETTRDRHWIAIHNELFARYPLRTTLIMETF